MNQSKQDLTDYNQQKIETAAKLDQGLAEAMRADYEKERAQWGLGQVTDFKDKMSAFDEAVARKKREAHAEKEVLQSTPEQII